MTMNRHTCCPIVGGKPENALPISCDPIIANEEKAACRFLASRAAYSVGVYGYAQQPSICLEILTIPGERHCADRTAMPLERLPWRAGRRIPEPSLILDLKCCCISALCHESRCSFPHLRLSTPAPVCPRLFTTDLNLEIFSPCRLDLACNIRRKWKDVSLPVTLVCPVK